MIRAWTNYVIVKTDTLYESNTKYKGVEGKQIVLDHRFDPMRHARIYGEVVSVPRHLSHKALWQEPNGLPRYADQAPFHCRYMDEFEQEVQVGDRAYYHFNVVPHNPIQFQRTHGNIVKIEGVHPNRTWYLRAGYDLLIAVVRNGVIIPVGSYVLCDPDFESWKDVTIQVPVIVNDKPMLDKHGKPVMKDMITKLAPEYKYLQATVVHASKPLKGDKCEVKEGQKIWYHRNADWLVRVEGRDYFAIRQRHIVGREEM